MPAKAADPLLVAVEADDNRLAGRELMVVLREIVGDAPLRMVDAANGIVETDVNGYALMSSDAGLTSVRVVRSGSASSPVRDTSVRRMALVEWTIRLHTTPLGSAPSKAMDPAEARLATHSAAIQNRRPFTARLRSPPVLGPGRLLVRGVDGAGQEIVRTVIDDPRLVRAETADASGRLVRHRQFIRSEALFNVHLPFDARIARLEILASDDGRTTRSLATVSAQ